MNLRRLKKVARKISYEVGFTGHGPTSLDVKRYGRLTPTERERYRKDMEVLRALKADAWKSAVMEVTGEDPDGW
jgi:hypothetical protein